MHFGAVEQNAHALLIVIKGNLSPQQQRRMQKCFGNNYFALRLQIYVFVYGSM